MHVGELHRHVGDDRAGRVGDNAFDFAGVGVLRPQRVSQQQRSCRGYRYRPSRPSMCLHCECLLTSLQQMTCRRRTSGNPGQLAHRRWGRWFDSGPAHKHTLARVRDKMYARTCRTRIRRKSEWTKDLSSRLKSTVPGLLQDTDERSAVDRYTQGDLVFGGSPGQRHASSRDDRADARCE